jgi:hypothetical protein
MADFSKYAADVAEVPTQRGRTFAQGLTFGFADEIEAGIRSLGGREYSELVKEVRDAVAEYQSDRPMEALGVEIGGAALPALIGSLFTGGAAGVGTAARIASKFPTIAKVAGIAAPKSMLGAAAVGTAQGALTGVGKGETLEDRAIGGLIGAPAGAILGGGAYAATEPLKRMAVGVADFARRKLGGRGAKIVETELQRLASESGMSVDEIVEGVASGRIMAENKTLLDAVRGYRAAGGAAATDLQKTFTARPEQTRQEAMSEIQRYLSTVDDPNILRGMQASDADARALEKAAYEPFKTQAAPDEVLNDLAEALRRVPSAAKEVEEALLASTGQKPFFSVDETGAVSFSRAPTMQEAEAIRRSLKGAATARYTAKQGVAGEAISDVESGLRTSLDFASPELAATRAQASVVRKAREAFGDGQKALSKNPDAIEVEFAKISQAGPKVLSAYRAGVMQAFRNKMSMGSRKSMMGALADPARKENRILSIVMPEDQLPGIMARVEQAAGSQAAASKILGGSDTAVTTSQQARQGMDIGAGEIAETLMSPNPMNIMRLLGKVAKRAAPQLSDAERQRVVQVLISENADLVRNALKDESGLAVLQSAIERITGSAQAGAQRAAPVVLPEAIQQQYRPQ